MPSLDRLNTPTHPFWDFVASLNENPTSNQQREPTENRSGSATAGGRRSNNGNSRRQPTVEDEEVTEPSARAEMPNPNTSQQAPGSEPQLPIRGRCGGEESTSARHDPHRGRPGGCRRGRGGRTGWFGCEQPRSREPAGQEFSIPPAELVGDLMGAFGMFDPAHHQHRRQYQCGRERHGNRDQNNNNNSNTGNDSRLGDYVSKFLSHLGVDPSSFAAADLVRERLRGDMINSNLPQGINFEPRADVFDTVTAYLIHLSLPGAKKEDLGVDWDGENSTLRIGGVVHRPGVNEETLKLLAVDGRKSEVGVFEKKIHLGTRRDPAGIDAAAISAKMIDGVLVIKVPKVEAVHRKREVPISSSSTSSTSSSPIRGGKQGADNDDYKDGPVVASDPTTAKTDPVIAEKGKQPASTKNLMDLDQIAIRSRTEAGDDETGDTIYNDPPEQLPEYIETQKTDEEKEKKHEGDMDSDDTEGEADYVKIDVN